MNNLANETITSKVYKGFQTIIPSKIRNELNINVEDTLNWKIDGDHMVIEVVKQKPIEELLKYSIYVENLKDNAVELKKKSGRGEF